MELLPGIVADNTTLYLPPSKTLILADLHIGYEEERLRRGGVLLPKEQKKYFKKELDRLFEKFDIQTVVLAGDIKHEFGTISREEWFEVQGFITGIRERGASVEAVKGNHDVLIEPILKKLDVELKKFLIIKNSSSENLTPAKKKDKTGSSETVLVVHGDATLDDLQSEGLGDKELKKIETIIMGHEHPVARITDGLRTETAKCFLVGDYRYRRARRKLVVMPSWNPLASGIDVVQERPLGPLLAEFTGFSAFAVVERKVLAFGRVERLRRL